MKITTKKSQLKAGQIVRCLLLLLFIQAPVNSYAADPVNKIEGVVTDQKGLPLIGATVIEIGTQNGTISGQDGRFKLNLTGKTPIVRFSYLGFSDEDVIVKDNPVINVFLIEKSYSLNEVVSIGYTTVNRKDLTSAVSSVSGNELQELPLSSVTQALTGKLSGVQITTSEGKPNAELKVRVRGGNSITQDNSPIYIIDGVNVEEGLEGLSVQDIASIDILKDAASTSIYGARGANGVVVVTTKKGREGSPRIAYNPSFGFNKVIRKYDVMDTFEFMQYQDERSRLSLVDRNFFIEHYGSDLSLYEGAETIDWQDRLFGSTAFQHRHNINISGGIPNFKYNIGYSKDIENGVMEKSSFSRDVFNSSLNLIFNKKLSLNQFFNYSRSKEDGAGVSNTGAATYNLLRNIVNYKPFLDPTDLTDIFDQDYFNQTGGNNLSPINPVALNNGQTRLNETDNFRITNSLNYRISNSLTFRTVLGLSYGNTKISNFSDSFTPIGRYLGYETPYVSFMDIKRKTINNSNTLTYNKKVNKIHSFSALLGQELLISNSDIENMALSHFPKEITYDKAFGQPSLGKPVSTYPTRNVNEARMLSYFSRLNYSYKDKYIFTGSYRIDGSSKFYYDYRWRSFPSLSAAWRISEERFMKGIDFIEDLKIRTSYGSAGNNRINDYLYLPTFDTGPFSYRTGSYYYLNQKLVSGYSMSSLPNQFVRWEKTNSLNVGFDVTFSKRYNISVDIYNNITHDLLINVPIPPTSGYTTQIQNVGKTQNKGVEIELSGPLVKTQNFSWDMDFNISFNSTKVLQISDYQKEMLISTNIFGERSDYILKEGGAVGLMYGYVNDGFYTTADFNYTPINEIEGIYTLKEGVVDASGVLGVIQPGTMKFRDIHQDGVINERDQRVIGDANPKFFGGLTQKLRYKSFDLSIFVNFVFGNSIYNLSKLDFTNNFARYSNMLSIMNDRWRTVDKTGNLVQYVEGTTVKGASPEVLGELNKNAKIWMPPLTVASAFVSNSWAVEDGSFIRLNNITLGYNFPENLYKKMRLQNLRAYVTINNLAVWTNYSGFDPEVNTRSSNPLTPGVDYSAYPRSCNFTFGLNITF